MEQFCKDTLWDHNLTFGNHRKYPMFTECFQDMALGTTPSIWLLTAFPIYLAVLYKTKDRIMEKSWIYHCKMGLAILQIAIRCNEILKLFSPNPNSEINMNLPRLLTYSIEVLAILLSTAIVDQERKKNYVTSFVLTMYWFFSSICGVIVYYCKVMEPRDDVTSTDLMAFQAPVACSILQMILHCCPEPSYIQEGKKPSPLARASFLSRLFYLWSNKYLVAGYSRPLNDDDFDELLEDIKCENTTSLLKLNWDDEKKRLNHGDNKKTVKVSLFRVLFKTYAKQLIGNNSLRCLDLVTDYMRPVVVGCLVGFADDKTEPTWKAFVYLFGFLIFNFGASVNFNYIIYQSRCVATRLKSALTNMIVQKSLKMTSRSRAEKTAGDMNNLITEDIEGLHIWVANFWVVWSVPFEFVLYTFLLYSVVGNAVYVALALMLLAMPLNTYFAKVGHKTHKAKTDLKDERIKLLTEVLNGIKVLKLYAWELAFGDKVLDVREKELKILQKMRFFGILAHLIWGIIPFFLACATLTAYVYLDENHVLTAKTAFTALSIFGALNGTFNAMPHIFTHFVRGYTCMSRLNDFFNMEEIDPNDVTNENSDNAISVNSGEFTWDPKLGACLKDINMDVPKGSLVAIVGRIGSGKSSLLSAILGDVEKDSGTVNVDGTTAYVPQQAWIQNATLRNNILFGGRLLRQTYEDVIEACALTKDLEMFKGRDLTEIGEKGINLSGGQKQRVSLARAVYGNADIYLFDDPLSAVDAHVGKHIFDHVIGSEGLLQNKTRILVTHGTTWLPFTDKVVVMENGRIIEQGPYEELIANDDKFAQFIKEYSIHRSDSSTSLESICEEESQESFAESGYMSRTSSSESEDDFHCIPKSTNLTSRTDATDFSSQHFHYTSKAKLRRSISKVKADDKDVNHRRPNKTLVDLAKYEKNGSDSSESSNKSADTADESGKLMKDEEVEEGLVKIRHLLTYFGAIGPFYCMIGLVAFILAKIVESLGSFNVKNWTSDPELQNLTEFSSDSEYRQEKNAYYMRMYAYIGLGKLFLDIVFRLMLTLRAIHAADMLHRNMLRNVLRGPMSFFDTTPVGRITHRFSSDIEPLDGSLEDSWKSLMNCVFDFLKVFVVVSITLPQFLFILPPIIYAYYYIQDHFVPTKRQISRMRSKRRSPIISHFSETLSGSSVIRAFSKQQQFTRESADKVDHFHEFEFVDLGIERWLSVRLDFLNVACIYGTVLLAVLNRDSLSGPVLGLALGTAALLHGCLHGFVRSFSELQKNLVCLEKIEDYTTKETEAPLHASMKPSESWPMNGDIHITNFSLRYREGQDLVLKGINADIRPGEKIGIVGRTGAGKSSLTIGLFRLVEAAEGRIHLDDHDISELGLYDLRSDLTILPQDPGLFSGTLRVNLDPMNCHSDDSIYNALQHAHLKPFVDSLPDKLEYQCGEGGQNLSVGQRQLICLARSLLRKSKVLVLDEATANVDMETDELIQTTIKTEFKECTVLTIAHRLNTIIDYDRILVLDKGVVKEFDTPKVLLADSNSEFYSMAKDAGIVK